MVHKVKAVPQDNEDEAYVHFSYYLSVGGDLRESFF